MNIKIMTICVLTLLILPISTATAVENMSKYTDRSNIESDFIISLINLVDEEMLTYYLEKLVSIGPRYTGTENCIESSKYILNEFERMGLDTYIDDWRYLRCNCQNVIAIQNGDDSSSDSVIVIGAHYDTTKNSPGANDDGSGVAAMLAIANILSQYSFRHDIRYVAFSGEEKGTFGSHADAKNAYERNENIFAVLNIDSVGNTTRNKQPLYVFTNERSEWLAEFSEKTVEKYSAYIDLKIQTIQNYPADHQPYMDYGYDGVQFTQGYIEDYGEMVHTPKDTIDKINYTYLIKVTKLILSTICELANKIIDLQVRIVSPYENYLYLYDRPISLPRFNLYFSSIRSLTYIIGKTTVKVNITTDEEIDGVFFGLDGDICSIYREPPYEWKLQKKGSFYTRPLIGKHTLCVLVYTFNGDRAYDEMDIFFIPQF